MSLRLLGFLWVASVATILGLAAIGLFALSEAWDRARGVGVGEIRDEEGDIHG
jgi:hypothetical protein